MTVGAVEFDSGSVMLLLLKFADGSRTGTVSGRIEPIVATIRKGVITYDRFVVHIDKYALAFSGTVDLNTRMVNIETRIPLDALARTIQELEGLVEGETVRVYYRGRFGDVEPKLDEGDLAEIVARAGLRGGLKELGKETGIPIGDILDELFKKKEKDKK